jgi:hypothetical protein
MSVCVPEIFQIKPFNFSLSFFVIFNMEEFVSYKVTGDANA